MTHLLVIEKFVSLQGEGASSGEPAAFLRLARCNLACSWCDTPYSWDFDRFSFESEVSEESIEQVAAWICENAPGRLILTGGEPLVQQKPLQTLLRELDHRSPELIIEVETNGTVLPTEALQARIDQWNVSPKLASSGEPLERRIRSSAFDFFVASDRANFKFVVSGPEDVAEANSLVDRRSIHRGRVLFMPEARTRDELRERQGEVAQWALASRVRLSGRLHLELYDGRRGT